MLFSCASCCLESKTARGESLIADTLAESPAITALKHLGTGRILGCGNIRMRQYTSPLASSRIVSELEREAASDRAAGHGDAGDFLVAGVGEIAEAEIRANSSRVVREGGVPDGVDGLLVELGELHGVADCEGVAQGNGPGGMDVFDGVVEDILGMEVVEGALCTVESGPGDANGLRLCRNPGERGFDTG